MSAPDLPAGVCRFCACSEHQPCEGGCAWTDDTETLCTQCLQAVNVAIGFVKVLGTLAGNAKAPVRLSTTKWDALTLEQQQVLVMACRAYLERVSAVLEEEQAEDAVDAMRQVGAIGGFVLERCPQELREGEPFADCIIRLLEPHVGSRIVLS